MRRSKTVPLLRIGSKRLETYKGIPIHADESLHEQAFEILRSAVAGGKVLDIGTGAGAFALRLHEAGYNVEALDLAAPEFRCQEVVSFFKVNLNDPVELQNFVRQRRSHYDAVAVVEVIEHIENPWLLLRACREMLKPSGWLLLTTPNISSFLSRVIFLRTGNFHQFGPGDLSYGHINPMTALEIELALRRTGFCIRAKSPGGMLPLLWLGCGWRVTLLFDLHSSAPHDEGREVRLVSHLPCAGWLNR